MTTHCPPANNWRSLTRGSAPFQERETVNDQPRATYANRFQILVGLALMAAVILACGDGGSSSGGGTMHSTPAQSTSTPSPTPTPGPSDLVRLNASRSDDVDGLHVQLSGLIDLRHISLNEGIACDPKLVLAAHDPTSVTYSPDDLNAIHDYLSSVSLDDGENPLPDAHAPSALRWAAGSASSIHSYLGVVETGACTAGLQVTNTSDHAIQIQSAGVALDASSVVNVYAYNLLNACSFAPDRFFVCGGGGGGQDGYCRYEAKVQLAQGTVGMSYSAPVTAYSGVNPAACPFPITLARGGTPGSTVIIDLYLNPPGSPNNLIFRVTPELTVYDGTTQTLKLPSLRSTLAYANAAQFSCYSLHGNTFVRTAPGTFLKPAADPALGLYCV